MPGHASIEIHPLLGIALAAGLIFLNGFYVLAEFAIVKVRASQVRAMREGGSRRAALLEAHVLPRLNEYLSVCQVGITVASILLGWVGEPAVTRILRGGLSLVGVTEAQVPAGVSVTVAIGIILGSHVVVGELLPKSLAIFLPERMALFSARPLRASYALFFPVTVALNGAANGLLRLIGAPTRPPEEREHSEQELRILLGRALEGGALEPSLYALLDNAFSFRRRTVVEVMVPKERVAFLSLAKTWPENLEVVRRARHTRYPLVVTGLEDAVGLIHLKDLLLRRGERLGRDPNLMRWRRDLIEIKGDTGLEKALAFLRGHTSHLALVRGAKGEILGIVCIEDIVETIVGSLEDEFDREERAGLAELLTVNAIVPEGAWTDRATAIRAAIDHLHARIPLFDPNVAFAEVERRENELSTAIGGGVSIPHALIDDLAKPGVAILRLRGRVPIRALDGRPVHLAFVVLIPVSNPGLRLRILGDVARIAQSSRAVERAAAAKTPEEAVSLLQRALAPAPTPPASGEGAAPRASAG